MSSEWPITSPGKMTERYEPMPACQSRGAGRTEAEELDLSACSHAQAGAGGTRHTPTGKTRKSSTMASEWPQVELGSLCSKIESGATPRGGEKVYLAKGKIALIRSQNIHNDGFKTDGLAYIAEENAEQLANVTVEPHDVLLNITGDSVARCCQVAPNVLPARVNQHVAIIRPNPQELHPGFLRYFFVSPVMQGKMLSWSHAGATRKALTKGMIESFKVPKPDLPVQQRIAHILGTLDDKIELNRRMNRTLEKMAAAIFKSWFIDFNPVHAKAEGRDPGLPAEITDLFPDSFEDSEFGEIPKGWKVSVVGDLAEEAIGGQWGSDSQVDGTVPAICLRGCDMEDLRTSGFASKAPTRFVKTTAISKRLPSERDVLIAASGAGPCGRPLWCATRIGELYGHPVIYSNFVKRFTTPSPAHAVYLDRFIIRKFNDRTIHDYINGTSVPNLDASGLLSTCKLLVPPNDVLQSYFEFCQPGFKRLYARQSVVLARLRDTLLPKLLSGEIELPEAEDMVNEHGRQEEMPASTGTPGANVAGRCSLPHPIVVAASDDADADEDTEAEEPAARLVIEDYSREDVLAALRDLYREDPTPCDREELLQGLRHCLGFGTLGPRIRSTLDGDLIAAVRRGVLERANGEYSLCCRTIDDYERDFLKEMFLQAIGRG